jgi:hypothetical protein
MLARNPLLLTFDILREQPYGVGPGVVLVFVRSGSDWILTPTVSRRSLMVGFC